MANTTPAQNYAKRMYPKSMQYANPLWSRTTKNRDVCTRSIARSFVHSFALLTHYLLCTGRFIGAVRCAHSITPSFKHYQVHGKVNDWLFRHRAVQNHSANEIAPKDEVHQKKNVINQKKQKKEMEDENQLVSGDLPCLVIQNSPWTRPVVAEMFIGEKQLMQKKKK